MRHIILLLFLGISLCCTAQKSYKYEKESRIQKEKFPQNALQFLEQQLPKKVKKVKYYKEQDSLKKKLRDKTKVQETKIQH
jgi:hypothetical protein